MQFTIIFDEYMLSQLKKLGQDKNFRALLSKMLDKMELLGPRAGKLIDSHLFLYEIKMKRPPLRLYYRYVQETNELHVFEYELKTSPEKQQKTIQRLLKQIQKPKSPRVNFFFWMFSVK